MNVLAIVGGALLVALVAWDAFESVVLPRRVLRPLRFARLARHLLWRLWTAVARRIASRLRQLLAEVGLKLTDGSQAETRLAKLHPSYEPYVNALSLHLLADLPPWLPPEGADERALLLV